MAYGDKPFGLRDVKIIDENGSAVDLPQGMTLRFTERSASGELKGDDKVGAVAAYVEAVDWELESGGISLAAWAALTGRSATEAGTTPNRTNTLTGSAQDSYPYVKLYGKSIGDGDDDIHAKLWKAKVTNLEGRFQGGDSPGFFVTSCTGVAIDDGTNGIWDLVQNETATDLPSS